MRWGYVINVTGLLVFFTGLTMAAPVGVSIIYKDAGFVPLAVSAAHVEHGARRQAGQFLGNGPGLDVEKIFARTAGEAARVIGR